MGVKLLFARWFSSMSLNEMEGLSFGLTEVDSRTLFRSSADFLTSSGLDSGEDLRREELPEWSEVGLSLSRPLSRFAWTLNFLLFFLKLSRFSLNQRLISPWSSFSCLDSSSSFLASILKKRES